MYAPLQGSYGFLPGSRWPDYPTFPTDQEIVHFPGMEPYPSDPRKLISAEDPNPDLHQPFFYMDAQTDFVMP